MKLLKLFTLMLFGLFLFSSCGEDDPKDLTIVSATIDGNTWSDGMTGVSVDGEMSVTFSKAIDPQKVINNTSIGSTGTLVESTAQFSSDSLSMTILHDDPYDAMTEYTLLIETGALAADGGMLVEDYERSFTTQ